MTDEELIDIYANAPIEKDRFELLKLEATWFSQTYYLQGTYSEEIEVEIDGVLQTVKYAPLRTGGESSSDELEYEVNTVIQSVNDLIAKESDNFDPSLRGNDRLPKMTVYEFISYRNGDIKQSSNPSVSVRLNDMNRDENATNLVASTVPTNQQATGEVVTINRNPMLKAFL